MSHHLFRTFRLAAISLVVAFFNFPVLCADQVDDLFLEAPATEDGGAPAKAGGPQEASAGATSGWRGFSQFELAHTPSGEDHWSKARLRSELGRSGSFGQGIKWKAVGRVDVDLAYGHEDDFYPAAVRSDKRSEFAWREVYLDLPLGNLELRLGRQHIVWGEMVGLFFADVVSAKDMREFFNQDFDQLRIPQWAARAEYFTNGWRAELIWVPYVSVDNIGFFGGDYYPAQPVLPGVSARYNADQRPDRKLGNSNYGLRVGTLLQGWDLSAFYYRSIDVNPTFARQFVTPRSVLYTPRHDWIHQYGGAVTKDFGAFLLKAEAVLTYDRHLPVSPLSVRPDGLVRQDMIDYALGVDIPFLSESRLNLQYFERAHLDRAPDLLGERREHGWSLLYNHKFAERVEGEVLWAQSLVRNDYMFRPKLIWRVQSNWRALFGADLFGGNQNGFFGRYGNADRYYGELRYSF